MFEQEPAQNVTVRPSSKDKIPAISKRHLGHDEWQRGQQTQISGSVVASSELPDLEASMRASAERLLRDGATR